MVPKELGENFCTLPWRVMSTWATDAAPPRGEETSPDPRLPRAQHVGPFRPLSREQRNALISPAASVCSVKSQYDILARLHWICETEAHAAVFGVVRVGVRDVVLIVIIAVAVPLSFIRPFMGILFWTWISYFNPQDFTWGVASRIPVGYLIAIPTLLGLIFTNRKQFVPVTRETVLLLMLWLWFCLTSVNVLLSPSLHHHAAETVSFLWLISKILMMVFVALFLITDTKRLRWWYLVTAGSFALFALKSSVFGVVTLGQFKVYGPRNSMIADNNDYGLAMNMVLPIFVALARTEQSRTLRWCFWAALPLGIGSVILTYSRGALLGLVVVLFALSLLSKRRIMAIGGAAVSVLVIFMAAPQQWLERMATIRDAAHKDPSALARLHSWTFAYHLFLDHPIFGGGFETFTAPLYSHYNMLWERVSGPHSIYFQMLAEQGLPGLLLFLGLIASCWWSCRSIRRRFKNRDTSFPLAAYATMIQLSIIPFLISGAFLGRAYFDLFYQLVATVILLQKFSRDEMRSSQQPLWEEGSEHATEPVGEGSINPLAGTFCSAAANAGQSG